jgi:hypothetical protein
MPHFPQYQNASLVTYSNYRKVSVNTAANPGDVIIATAAVTITLPPVAFGGPVLVKNGTAFGSGHAVTVNLAATDVTASVVLDAGAAGTINGGLVLTNAGDQAVFASDGSTTWWIIDARHNTHDTW